MFAECHHANTLGIWSVQPYTTLQGTYYAHVCTLNVAPQLVRRELLIIGNIQVEAARGWMWDLLDMVHLLFQSQPQRTHSSIST
jgi:hypothetical protein